MHASSILGKLGLSALGICLSALAAAEPLPEPGQRYQVVDVAPGDVLSLHVHPDVSADVVGTLPAEATGIAIAGTYMKVDEQRWWQVITPGGLGWVNAENLQRVDAQAPDEDIFPLRCSGTEPFWTLTVEDDEATFATPQASRSWQAGEMTRAMGLTGRYAVRLESDDEVGHLAVWRARDFCSDGMSNIRFPFGGIIAAPEGTTYAGCCLRGRE